jgi:hypothetical protein
VGEQRKQSGSAARAAALHCAGRHIEDAGRLGHGVALHVHQDEGGTLVGREGAQRTDEFAVEVIALCRSGGGLVRFEELLQALGVIDGGRPSGSRLAGAVQAGVHRDAVQPGRDGRLAPEGVGCPVGGDERVLDRVSGLLAVSQRPQGHRPQAVAMAPYKLTEGVRIAFDVAGQEVLIACFAVSGFIGHRTPLPSVDEPQPVNFTSVMACL